MSEFLAQRFMVFSHKNWENFRQMCLSSVKFAKIWKIHQIFDVTKLGKFYFKILIQKKKPPLL
jgi:hypothetical protein